MNIEIRSLVVIVLSLSIDLVPSLVLYDNKLLRYCWYPAEFFCDFSFSFSAVFIYIYENANWIFL